MLTFISTLLGVLLAFILNNLWVNHSHKKAFKEMIKLMCYELENDKICIINEEWAAVSFETFKALSSNPIFIRHIKPNSFNSLWKVIATLRVMKDAKMKNKIPADTLMQKWFNGEIHTDIILDIVIKKLAKENIGTTSFS